MPKAKKNNLISLDTLPEDQIYWKKVYNVLNDLADAYGFDRLELPVAEREDLFTKKLKEYTNDCNTDICVLQNISGDRISLRPDFVPSISRAYLDNNLAGMPKPVRLHTTGPIFCGGDKQVILTQDYQASFEIIGEKDSVIDAQLVQLLFSLGKELGFKNLITQINNIGCSRCRPAYRKALVNFYKDKEKMICSNCNHHLMLTPMKLLSCKDEKCAKLISAAPQMIDYLCHECHDHFISMLEFLDEVNIPYILNPYLFKSTNYHTKTIFEVAVDSQGGSVPFAFGHRHDDLIGALGGESTPAAGVDVRMNSIVDLMKINKIKVNIKQRPLIFLVQLGVLGKKKSLVLFEQLRRGGLRVASSVSYNTMTSQVEAAKKLGARFVLILGQKEALDDTIIVRDAYSGIQEIVPINKLVKNIKKRLKEK
ncbi:MAG: HisS family protein [bacterium]